MHIILFCLLIFGLLVLSAYFLFQVIEDMKQTPKMLKGEKEKKKIITEIYKNAGRKRDKTGSEMEKVDLITKLNIFPKELYKHIQELVKDRLVIQSKDSVSLTTFGVEYYEVFIHETKKTKVK